jgi:hypothetical protein
VQVPRFSKFLHGMALLHPQRCSESPRWFVWEEAAGCAVPAGLEEMRGISEERIHMKQQVGCLTIKLCVFPSGIVLAWVLCVGAGSRLRGAYRAGEDAGHQ